MSDETPRKLRGSLIERAAARQPFPESPVFGAAPMPMPAPSVEPAPAVPAESISDTEPFKLHQPMAEPVPPVSQARHRLARIDRGALAEAGMLVPGGAVTPLAEEFRMVKRQLLLTARKVAGADADRARMILICSAQPNEGKTFCAINLALSMASEKDFEILLVDADFAKPDVLPRLGIADGPGLLDALDGRIDVEDCIIDTDVPHLSLLPAGGRTNSDTELLASDHARTMLDRLAAADPRRIVIFDSPPALAASPASVLALHVGQTLMVVRADRTTEGDVRAAIATLDACEHIQLVLNAVSFQPFGRRFGSYYKEAGK